MHHAVLTSILALVVTGCTSRGYRFSHYENIDPKGWVRTDTLHFTALPVSHYGSYTAELGLRTTSRYPFMQLMLIVCQKAKPSGYARTDTIRARLTDDDGLVTGEGITHYQYVFPLPAATLAAGDTLHVTVHHDMLRSPLVGITDVGFSLTDPIMNQ